MTHSTLCQRCVDEHGNHNSLKATSVQRMIGTWGPAQILANCARNTLFSQLKSLALQAQKCTSVHVPDSGGFHGARLQTFRVLQWFWMQSSLAWMWFWPNFLEFPLFVQFKAIASGSLDWHKYFFQSAVDPVLRHWERSRSLYPEIPPGDIPWSALVTSSWNFGVSQDNSKHIRSQMMSQWHVINHKLHYIKLRLYNQSVGWAGPLDTWLKNDEYLNI